MKCLVGLDRVAAGAVLAFVLHLCVVSRNVIHVGTLVILANLSVYVKSY